VSAPLQFWFEFASTYSYLSAMRIERIATQAGVELAWRPFLLGPIFNAQGWDDTPFNLYPAKGKYMWRDMGRLCAKYGLPLKTPAAFPQKSMLAARLATAAEDEAWCPELVRGIYNANFAGQADVSDPAVLAAILKMYGQSEHWLERAKTQEVKDRLRDRTAEAAQMGMFGAPNFVARGELFWGNDRLEDAVAWHLTHEKGGKPPFKSPPPA